MNTNSWKATYWQNEAIRLRSALIIIKQQLDLLSNKPNPDMNYATHIKQIVKRIADSIEVTHGRKVRYESRI